MRDRQTGKLIDIHTENQDRLTDRQTDRQTDKVNYTVEYTL